MTVLPLWSAKAWGPEQAGAAELAWFNARSGTSIAPLNEGGLISTTAEGGAGAEGDQTAVPGEPALDEPRRIVDGDPGLGGRLVHPGRGEHFGGCE